MERNHSQVNFCESESHDLKWNSSSARRILLPEFLLLHHLHYANPNVTIKIICQSISGAKRFFNYYQQRAKMKISINFPIAGHTWISKQSRVIREPQFDQPSCVWIGRLTLVFRFLCTPLERKTLTISFWTRTTFLILHDRREINFCFHFCKSTTKQIYIVARIGTKVENIIKQPYPFSSILIA